MLMYNKVTAVGIPISYIQASEFCDTQPGYAHLGLPTCFFKTLGEVRQVVTDYGLPCFNSCKTRSGDLKLVCVIASRCIASRAICSSARRRRDLPLQRDWRHHTQFSSAFCLVGIMLRRVRIALPQYSIGTGMTPWHPRSTNHNAERPLTSG